MKFEVFLVVEELIALYFGRTFQAGLRVRFGLLSSKVDGASARLSDAPGGSKINLLVIERSINLSRVTALAQPSCNVDSMTSVSTASWQANLKYFGQLYRFKSHDLDYKSIR